MDDSLKKLIDQANSVLILLNDKPNLDEVAAGLALYLSLRNQKEVQIASPNPMTVEFNRLVGVNKVSQEMGNKNLIIHFSDYKANDIERVSYDIEDGRFRLTVIPKPGITPPGKSQIELSYAGINADAVVLVGGSNESQFPAINSKDLAGAKLIHLGNQSLSSIKANIMSFARAASSTSQVIANLIRENGYPLDEDVSTNLLAGIEYGSKNFANSDADTFELFAQLLRAGGKRPAVGIQPDRFPPGSIPGRPPTASFPYVPQSQQANQGQQNQSAKPQKEDVQDDVPQDWLEPRIYKGTTVK